MYKIGIILLILLACACGHNSELESLQEDDALQHANAASQFTLFSENTEFFIEHEPLIAGEESEFLVHLTDLSTYGPLISGSISIRIDEVTVTSDKFHRPGILEVPFIPKKAGSFHAEYIYQSGTVTETVSDQVHIDDDHQELQNPEVTSPDHAPGIDEVGEITFLKEQAWKSDFMVGQIMPVPFAAIIHSSGEIMAVPGEKKNIAAAGSGIVHFSNRNLVQGSPVTEGQLLFTLNSETMIENNVKLQYQEALNRYQKSQSEYERHKLLYAQGAISERQFITTRSLYMADSLRFSSLDANTSDSGLKVYAPVSGTVHELNVSEGEFIQSGQLLVTISSNKTLLLRADLSQQFYNQLNEIETAHFRPAYTDQVYSVEEMNGRLLAAGSSVAENDHYLPIIFEVDNDGSLLEGAFAEIFLKSSHISDVLVVPMSAILEEQGEYYVYVQVTGESYTKRGIAPGKNDGRNMEILSGLDPGERVVTRGVMLVKAASMVTGVVGDGHAH